MEKKAGLRLHFNLKQVRDKETLTQIMLITTINHKRIRIYTRLRVEPKYWVHEEQCCDTPKGISLRDRLRLKQINERLEQLAENLESADERAAQRGEYLSAGTIREVVRSLYHNHEPPASPANPLHTLRRFAEEYEQSVNRRGRRGIESTKSTYLTALSRLEDYNRCRKVPIGSFDDFDKHFFTGFTNYLYSYTYGKDEKHYTQNTIVNTLKVLKNLLHRAYDNELTSNNYFLKVQTTLPADASQQVYLRESEIRRLAEVHTESDCEREVRDAFVIACYTALRISDVQQLDKATIRQGVISLYQKKTKELVEIPILKEIAPLVEHYRQVGFPRINKHKANRIIKILAARCGINEMVSHKEQRGGEVIIIAVPKWQLVSFHTARRSCVTNLYKRGYPINYVMSLSGHRSIQAFQRYMKATSKELMADFFHLLKKEKAVAVKSS